MSKHASNTMSTFKLMLETIERRIAAVGSKVAEVEDAERVVIYAARSQETMREFRERLTRSKMDHLGREILDAFGSLTHKESLVADIRVQPNDLGVVLFDSCAHEIPKSRLSSGERQMLAVAILWGLARASGSLPVMIDTPMARLDSSHRQTFVSAYLPHASHQVIVFSTDTRSSEILLNLFENTLAARIVWNSTMRDKKPALLKDIFRQWEGEIVIVRQFTLSAQAKEQLICVKARTGIQHWNILCRWALCLSLREPTLPVDVDIPADSNVELSWHVFGGEFHELYEALVIQRCLDEG